jgi:hypothetical protein
MSEATAVEIDAFIGEHKTLTGYMPAWSRRTYGNEWQSRWAIEDLSGTQRGELCFSIDLALQRPSIVATYEGHMFYRVDVVPPDFREENMYGAHGLGLPRYVWGPHTHSWKNNRGWCSDNGFQDDLPYREEISKDVIDFDRAIEILSSDLNIIVTPGQRGITLPAKSLV